MYYKPGIKEPRFNLMYDKFRFYQRLLFYFLFYLFYLFYFIRSFFGKMEIFSFFFGLVFFFFSLPKDFFLFLIFPLRVISVKSFHVGILSST